MKTFIEKRKIAKQRKSLLKEYENTVESIKNTKDLEVWAILAKKAEELSIETDALETRILNRKLINAGLSLPNIEEYSTGHIKEGSVTSAVTFLPKMKRIKYERDLRIEKRTSLEFWVKFLIPIITTLTGLIGVIIGLLTILKK